MYHSTSKRTDFSLAADHTDKQCSAAPFVGSSDTGRTSAQIPIRQCALSATQGIPHQTTTAPLSANSAAWPTPRLARIAAKNCDHRLRHCESGKELSPHSGGNNNPPQIPSLLSNDDSHRTSRTNDRGAGQPSLLAYCS
ncbi:hypothetical protein HPB47_027857 [Ixodes persulcatus]|uniref:Uncharacterized protein n=1 Tax=Ixodes persulcatus TaxID=34615 RepID=A0AC60PUT0_IXOPE|nr:hypothetical protein HPB47_027857 [Ixodes persulcatus]